MKTELKGWLADNTVTTDNKEDKILVLESAGNLTLSDVLDEMKKEDTGLRAETLKHAVDLFQRTVSELVLNGYSVNTGLFRAVPQFRGVIDGGVWNPERNSIYVSFNQDKDLREAIARTGVKILGAKGDSAYFIGVFSCRLPLVYCVVSRSLYIPSVRSAGKSTSTSEGLFTAIISIGSFVSVPFSSIKTIPTAGSVPATLMFLPCKR